jgi:NAD-dependent deacetylase
VLVITQNVDDLHERAGSKNVLHMHGELFRALCLACGQRYEWRQELAHGPACPGCGHRRLRPDIVWFGEMPYHMGRIQEALDDCRLFASIGTSGTVYPAANFVALAAAAGAHTTELNLDASAASSLFDDSRQGPATTQVPLWVDELLA